MAASAPTVPADKPRPASNALLTPLGAQARSSMLCRSSAVRPAVRAITASRTLSGSGASGWSRIWLTKKGLPAVRRWTSAGSRTCPSSSSATAARLSGVSCMRRAPGVETRSPTTGLSAESVAIVSRHDTIISNGSASMRRATKRMRSVVASSAQCRSSTTRTRGVARNASSTAAKISCWAADPRRLAVTADPSASATSRSGPSGRGVLRGSHMPHSTGIDTCSAKARRSAVLPMPASPTSTTRPPWPAAARSARVCSTSIGWSRSSSRTGEV